MRQKDNKNIYHNYIMSTPAPEVPVPAPEVPVPAPEVPAPEAPVPAPEVPAPVQEEIPYAPIATSFPSSSYSMPSM